MTKKQRTVMFLIAATLANILLILFLLILFTVLGGLIFKKNIGIALPFLFFGAVIAGIFIYQKAVQFIIKKFGLEEKMEPLFGSSYRRNKLD